MLLANTDEHKSFVKILETFRACTRPEQLTDVEPPSERSEVIGKLFEKEVAIVGMLHRAGIPIVAGTDQTVPGHSLHREIELYVQAGFTPMEAIQAATIVPARAMGLDFHGPAGAS